MYSSSYKANSGTLKAFEDAYAREDFLRRSSSSGNTRGCTPFSEHVDNTVRKHEVENCDVEKKEPSFPCKPKGSSSLLSGMDGGDILLILLILFFLTDKDSENDSLIPILLALILLF